MKSHPSSIAQGVGASASNPPVIHVVDDDVSFRGAVARVLGGAGYQVFQYPSAELALEKLPNAGRGCILLDVQMPTLSGPLLQQQLTELGCELPIIFLTGHGDIATSVHAIKAGAEDFLPKPVAKATLLEAIERALRRYDTEHEVNSRQHALQALVAKLTPREHEVFALVVRGKMNKQIAHQLGIAERTIKAHRQSIMSKLEATSITELVTIAERLQIPGTDK